MPTERYTVTVSVSCAVPFVLSVPMVLLSAVNGGERFRRQLVVIWRASLQAIEDSIISTYATAQRIGAGRLAGEASHHRPIRRYVFHNFFNFWFFDQIEIAFFPGRRTGVHMLRS